MKRMRLVAVLALGLVAGCTTTGGVDRRPVIAGSEAIVAGDHDVLAYVTVGGVTCPI